MIDNDKIVSIAKNVASANLSSQNIARVFSEAMVDSQGDEALRIVIIIKPDAVPQLSGGVALDNLFQIKEQLQLAGEERFPIIEYATQEEIGASGSSES